MKEKNKGTGVQNLNILLLLLIFSLMSFSGSVFSAEDQNQDSVNAEETDSDEDDDEDVVELEPVVATGSRLLRTTYESISPVQVITADQSRAVGQFDAADILQNSTAASGQQIDLTFAGFVLDNGPGSSTLSFRGLGAGRTLLMLNGRRLGPSGVEGAPTAPDLNLIPSALISQYELLLDGSSSLYGSDAVAGVGNAILRKDFDGFELTYSTSIPEQSKGLRHDVSLVWGKNFDRGFIGFGANLVDQEAVRLADRKITNHCTENIEVDENGEIRSFNHREVIEDLNDFGNCVFPTLAGRVFYPGTPFGSIYSTPGISNGGFAGFSESTVFGLPVDSNGDGAADINFLNYGLQDYETDTSLFPEQKSQNFMSYGEYTFEGENNITPFFEFLYSRRDSFQDAGAFQTFPTGGNPVPANNPYNLCNPNSVNGGVDCGLGWDALMANPAVIAAILAEFGCDPSAGGSCDQTIGALGAIPARPIVSIDGDRSDVSSTIELTRFVAGIKGDIPQISFGQMNSWNFETYVSTQESDGTASRKGVRQDRLEYSLNTSRVDPNTGEVICGNNDGCVPVNLFAPSLYAFPVGSLATQAERDYLFDDRTFRTKVRQDIFFGFINGYVYELPAGPISAGIGIEVRKDSINSQPNDVANDGLLIGFFADQGASGSKFTREAFTEIEIPILAGMKGAEELTLNLSGRITKDEFYSSNSTFSAKIGYRPIPSLLIKATVGTSYRAPNLRENFLRSQTGFGSVFDPCFLPADAFTGIPPEYDPDLDNRSDQVITNCINTGVDPFALDNGGQNVFSTEVASGGATDINEEESDSFTYGFAWEVPLDSVDLTIGATYYSIEINNTIITPSARDIVGACYNDREAAAANTLNPFCSRISRDPESGEFDIIDAGFINRDNKTVRGVDVNINLDKEFTIFDRAIDFGMDIVMTHTEESSDLFVDDLDSTNTRYDDDAREFGFPDWSGTLAFRASYDKWSFIWQTRYIGKVRNDPRFVDYFGNANGADVVDIRDLDGDGDTEETISILSHSCLGPDEGDVNCRDVDYAGSYFNHSTSITYREDDWSFRFGVRNIFDRNPPRVDASEVLSVANNPIGYGYDLNGRVYFATARYNF